MKPTEITDNVNNGMFVVAKLIKGYKKATIEITGSNMNLINSVEIPEPKGLTDSQHMQFMNDARAQMVNMGCKYSSEGIVFIVDPYNN